MTATPTPDRGQVIGEMWISDSIGFPLNKTNFMVAAAQMVAARVSLNIEGKEKILPVTLNNEDVYIHSKYLRDGGKWTKAAEHVRKACFPQMASKIIDLADKDRSIYPNGGVLVFMDNINEVENISTLLKSLITKKSYKIGIREGNEKNASIGIAITTKNDTAGFNFVRMGAIVTGVYGQSAASRHQLRGRIRRIGQIRQSVEFWTVFPSNTILSMLFERHNTVDAKNSTLEQMAHEFTRKERHPMS